MKLSQNIPFTLIIDEFQEFVRINPSVFSEIQREWDLNKSTSKLNLIISGSVFTLMRKIFEDYNEPLFGRANQQILVKPFSTEVIDFQCLITFIKVVNELTLKAKHSLLSA